MSKGPAGTTGSYNPKNRLNVKITKEDFCLFADVCLIDSNLDRNLCLFCEHRDPIDIKQLLYAANCERNKEC